MDPAAGRVQTVLLPVWIGILRRRPCGLLLTPTDENRFGPHIVETCVSRPARVEPYCLCSSVYDYIVVRLRDWRCIPNEPVGRSDTVPLDFRQVALLDDHQVVERTVAPVSGNLS